MFWRAAYHKLLHYQLKCPACHEFGMDRNPVQYFSILMRHAKVLVEAQRTGTAPITDLQCLSFLLDQLLGRTGTTTDQPLGIPNSWIRDSRNLRTLQATARATLPTANPTPTAVACMPIANTSDHHEKLEDNPVGQLILDIFRRKRVQEEIDRKAAADSPNTPTNEAKSDDLEYLEIDLNNLDQQRSKCLRLQAEANKKTAAKKTKSMDEEDKKIAAADHQPATTHQPRNHQTIPPRISNEEAEKWLCKHKAKVSLDGVVQADCPIPPQVQQWLENKRREATALRQLTARPQARPSTATVRGTVSDTMPASTHSPITTTAHNREKGKQDHEESPTRLAQHRPSTENTSQTATLIEEDGDWLSDNVLPWLSNNNITLNDNGSYHSDSTIPPLVQQWLNLAQFRNLTLEDYATGFRHL